MSTDALNRRLRFAEPQPQVARLILTPADFYIFEVVNRHGPLPSHYLYEFTKHLRRDKSHLLNRLTEFYNGDQSGPYLTRPPQQFAGFEARYQHMVYDLAPRALAYVDPRPSRKDPFLHRLMQACVSASFELTLPAHQLRYISQHDILKHPRCGDARDAANPLALPMPGGGALIPDELFGIEYPEAFRFFAVEVDRNTESIERKNLEHNTFGKKVALYNRVLEQGLQRSWWGVTHLSVLTVTTNTTHAKNILSYVAEKGSPKLKERFAITTLPEFGPNWRVPKTVLTQLLDEPWQTVAGSRRLDVA